ncbi:hypothetical protein AGLY_005226 [Aphis glycines]|uniref:C2H2-type domain-containing protein n=1 Tax=Aphis glycines TaxID=307491 RepID=A0A6G0TWI5_APHGL|nr:hypothetical protein AGLY_005226 [Aphis glycines]
MSSSKAESYIIVKIPGIKGRNFISLQNFNCDECGVKFKHNCILKKHLLKMHNIKTQTSKENTIKCLKCKKAFTQRKNMIRHMKMHLEEVDTQTHQDNLGPGSLELESSKIINSQPMHVDLQSQIPTGYKYSVIEYTSLGEKTLITKFFIHEFGVDVVPFIMAMRDQNKITYLATNMRKPNSSEIILKIELNYYKRYRCHHNTRPKINSNSSQKHFNCKATLGMQIVKDEQLWSEFPNNSEEDVSSNNLTTKAEVQLKHIHNHKILRAEVLKHRRPTNDVETKFLRLFEEGKTLSKALFTFKSQLRNEKGNSYYIYAGDRGELPDPQWVYYLYYKSFKKHFGYSHGEHMMTSLKEAVEEYNIECNSDMAGIKNFAIAIQTPLMKRISCGFDECGEIFFIDASGNIDRFGCKVFMIYSNSCAGGLPIGTIILTSA